MNDLTLLLNTAEKRIQFALCRDGVILCFEDWLAQRGGTELLAPSLRSACSQLGESPLAIRRIACVAGPGNFTGLRIGITTASGLARATGALQAGLSYLQCLALNALPRPGETVMVLTNARRDLAYCALFRADVDGIPQPEGKTFLLNMPCPADRLPVKPDIVLGSALSSNREQFRSLLPPDVRLLSPLLDHPTAASLLAAERLVHWEEQDGSDIAPLYLRDCDAMENFESIVRSQGRTPELARRDLDRLMASAVNESQSGVH